MQALKYHQPQSQDENILFVVERSELLMRQSFWLKEKKKMRISDVIKHFMLTDIFLVELKAFRVWVNIIDVAENCWKENIFGLFRYVYIEKHCH